MSTAGPDGKAPGRVLVAMSGGVDSGAAAALLCDAGYDVLGVTMRLCENAAGDAADALADARAVCGKLGVPFSVLDLREDFSREVIGRFIREYEAGNTPNPCLYCNRALKFGALLTEADRLGCDKLATGHYARVEYDGASGRWLLRKARCLAKDQSYVLYGLTQAQLARVLFPLGDVPDKESVRRTAVERGLVNAHRHDSQDICFVPDGDYAKFISGVTGKAYAPGPFIGPDGRVLGEHRGLIRYTVGQRKGLGLALPEPLYVLEKRVADNAVLLGRNEDLFSRELEAGEVNWIACEVPTSPLRVSARVRYSQTEQPATVEVTGAGEVRVMFDEPQRAIAAGQAVVFYDGDTVVGGGIIRARGEK